MSNTYFTIFSWIHLVFFLSLSLLLSSRSTPPHLSSAVFKLVFYKRMHYCLPFDPILTLVTQKSVWADSVLSVRHRPLSSNTSQPNSSLQMFYSFVPNHLLPPDISKLFHSIFSFRIISVPHSPISSHFSSPFMYFSHSSPTSVDGNVSICPREHEG